MLRDAIIQTKQRDISLYFFKNKHALESIFTVLLNLKEPYIIGSVIIFLKTWKWNHKVIKFIFLSSVGTW